MEYEEEEKLESLSNDLAGRTEKVIRNKKEKLIVEKMEQWKWIQYNGNAY